MKFCSPHCNRQGFKNIYVNPIAGVHAMEMSKKSPCQILMQFIDRHATLSQRFRQLTMNYKQRIRREDSQDSSHKMEFLNNPQFCSLCKKHSLNNLD